MSEINEESVLGTEVPAEAGKGIAMQVASMNPVAVNKDSVPQSVIDKAQ